MAKSTPRGNCRWRGALLRVAQTLCYNVGAMWYRIQVVAYLSLIVGHAMLLLLVVRHRPRTRQVQHLLEADLFLAMLWVIGLGGIAVFSSGAWSRFLWYRTAQIGLVILALLTAEFANAFVRRSDRRWLWRGFVTLPVLSAITLDTLPGPWLGLLRNVFPASVQRTDVATVLLVAAWGISMARAWGISTGALRRATGSKHRNRIRYLLAAVASFAVGDLLVLVSAIPDVHAGLTARLLGFGIAAFALLYYNLPDVKRFSLVSLCFVLLSGLTALVYLVALLVVTRVSGIMPDPGQWMADLPAVALALLLAAGVDVLLRPRLQHLLNRTVLGQTYDVQKALRAYSQQINLILDLERLADTTLDWVEVTFDVRQSAFVLFTPQGNDQVELRLLRARSGVVLPPQIFSTSSRFILHFHNVRRPLSQYDLDMLTWFQGIAADERRWLQDLALDLYIPILVADKPVALLALAPKSGGRPYSDEDLETLMTLAGQTGTALQNARLVDDLRAVQDDLHSLSTQLAETNRQLKRLDETKTDFITIASHELRTPLAQIYGYSDILTRLQDDDLSDAQVVHQFIEGITRGATRLKRVLDAMVDLSLIETGSMKIHPVPFPVGTILQNAVDAVRAATSGRKLDFTLEDLSALPYVRADSSRLEQVFISLLNNAAKFTPDGGEIAISGRLAGTLTDPCVEVMVTDTGIGIEPDEQELVFQKFHRAENVLHHSSDDIAFKGAGPGLGLSIARGIVEAHGGRIWVESPGRDEERCPGSTFYVCLPVEELAPEPDHG
jgi:signal transduction histidine kinase